MNHDQKVLTRSKHGLVSGTLRGLAQHYNLKLWKLQLVFLILLFCGVGLIAYLVLWASIPSYSQRETLLENLNQRHE